MADNDAATATTIITIATPAPIEGIGLKGDLLPWKMFS